MRLPAVLSGLMLAGCASFSEDAGFSSVEKAAQERLGKQARWVRTEADAQGVRAFVRERLAAPLSIDDAVQIALFNNPELQATYAELGIAEADLVQAGRMTNPHFAYLRTRNREAQSGKIEWALTFPIVDLLTIPLRKRIEAERFAAVQLEVSIRTLEVALETRRAWIGAVGAGEAVRYQEQVRTAAEASAELARRMARAGNLSRLAQMREQAFYAEVTAQLARARQAALAERERLTRLLGLYGEDVAFQLPERLPELPDTLPDKRDLEATAVAQRFDIQAARRDTEALARSLGLSKATRFVNALELGPAQTREDSDPWNRGFEFSLEIPIFDWGTARVAKAEAIYMQSVSRLAATAIAARSEVREASSAYRTAYDTARHYRDEIVPLRRKISEETLLRYNAMLISTFELLADAREQVAAVNAYLEALREFWLAESDIQGALTGAAGEVPGAARRAARRVFRNPALGGH